MRVLLVSRCLPLPQHYGDRLILRWLLPALRSRGHVCDVIALTLEDDSRYLHDSRPLCDWLDTVDERPRTAADFARRLLGRAPQAAAECWNPPLWDAVERRMAEAHYDAVHVFGGVQVYEIAALAQRRPAIITPYESHALLASTRQADARSAGEWLGAGVERVVARRFEQTMFDGFSSVVVLSERDRASLLDAAPGLPVVVIPNGVRVPAPQTAARPASVLVFVGNFEYGPNVRAAQTLVGDVLPRVRAHIADAEVLLVGANPPAEVRALAGAHVKVTGFVPEIAPYLARATCFVAPLTQGAGLKNKVLEAMAAGVPVVATRIGVDGIAASDGREAFIRNGSDAIASAVVELLSQPERRHAMAAAARALVERDHSWDHVALRYEQLYEAAASGFAAAKEPGE